MLDFSQVRSGSQKISALGASLSVAELRTLTNEMINTMHHAIAESIDADVTFVPSDPGANDTFAAGAAEVNIAWTLGHVIVHATASSEESAFLAAELARGIAFHGRSRAEVAWETVTTIAQCRQRLEESRRMRLASLDIWPDAPNYEAKRTLDFMDDSLDARGQFILGLLHDDSHLGQVAEVVRQAREARS